MVLLPSPPAEASKPIGAQGGCTLRRGLRGRSCASGMQRWPKPRWPKARWPKPRWAPASGRLLPGWGVGTYLGGCAATTCLLPLLPPLPIVLLIWLRDDWAARDLAPAGLAASVAGECCLAVLILALVAAPAFAAVLMLVMAPVVLAPVVLGPVVLGPILALV